LSSALRADIWNINSVEPIAPEYSRFSYNATSFSAPDQFRAVERVGLVRLEDGKATITLRPYPATFPDNTMHHKLGEALCPPTTPAAVSGRLSRR
jgi:hypothetical protein